MFSIDKFTAKFLDHESSHWAATNYFWLNILYAPWQYYTLICYAFLPWQHKWHSIMTQCCSYRRYIKKAAHHGTRTNDLGHRTNGQGLRQVTLEMMPMIFDLGPMALGIWTMTFVFEGKWPWSWDQCHWTRGKWYVVWTLAPRPGTNGLGPKTNGHGPGEWFWVAKTLNLDQWPLTSDMGSMTLDFGSVTSLLGHTTLHMGLTALDLGPMALALRQKILSPNQ